jgi:hypothetical protein
MCRQAKHPQPHRAAALLSTDSTAGHSCLQHSSAPTASSSPSPRSFTISSDQFIKDGRPFRIIAGEVHYFRWGGVCGGGLSPARMWSILQSASQQTFWCCRCIPSPLLAC